MYFDQIDEKRRTAIYVRISTAMQKTDRQVEELVAFAKANRLNFDESTDIYKDIISGFKDGEDRPNFSILMGKLVVNPEEAKVVRTIFEKFSKGEKTTAITDWLNASGIPCSFRTRIAAANQRRINKGIAPAKYKRGNVDNMIWRTTTVNRIVKNKVYIGVQHHKFHEPDPSNPLPSREPPENPARCGECGNRFCAVTLPMGRSYKCAGRTGVCKVKCSVGASVLMSKLDGLVLKLCIDKFAKYDLQQKAKGKIQKLDTGIEEKTRMFNEYSARQKEATENYTTVLKRAIRYARDEAEADALVAEAKEDYDRVSEECAKSLERIKAELDGLKHLKRSLSDIRDSKTLSKKSDEIMSDCSLVKDYIYEYVTDIVLYKPDESWVLVIVHFVDGSERWGTIKNERYKKSELRQDDLFDKVKYTGWLVNNDNHRFHYDKERRLFSELKYGKAIGEYSFAVFD